MNKLLLTTLLIPALTSWGQNSAKSDLHPVSAAGLHHKSSLPSQEKTLICQDTLRYAQAKEQILGTNNFYTFDVWQSDVEAFSQAFLNAGTTTIRGIEFFGANNTIDGTANVTVTASLYNVNASFVPTTVIASGTVTFSSATAGYHFVNFATPMAVTGNYAVVIQATSVNGIVTLYVNDAAPAQIYDENFSKFKSNFYSGSAGAYVGIPALGIGNYNFEALIAPMVTYTVNTSFTASPNPSCLGTPVVFTNTSTPASVISNRMYNYQQFRLFFGTAPQDSTFVYDMDNLSPLIWSANTTYTYPAAGTYDAELNVLAGFWNSCADAATLPITINPVDNATFAYSSNTLCSGGGNETPTTSSAGTFSSTAGLVFANTTTGEIDMTASTDGSYVITYTTGGICPATTTQTVTITSAPDASFTFPQTDYCSAATDPLPSFGAGASSGTFSSTPGLSINPATGMVDLSASTAGTYVVTNSIAAAGVCPASSSTYSITVLPTPVVTVNSPSFCAGASGVTLTASGAPMFDWSPATGLSAVTGATVTANPAVTTTYTVTGTSAAGCLSTATSTVTVNPNPAITFGALSAVCESQTQVGLSAATPVGGTYSGTGVTGGFFNASTAGPGTTTITYNYTDANGCSASATGTIEVLESPDVTLTVPTALCTYDAPVALVGTPAGGTYAGTGVASGMFDPAVSGAGSFLVGYGVTASNGCTGSAEQTIIVDACLGVEEFAGSDLLIVPNPSNDFITISFTNIDDNDVELTMVSGDGKLVALRTIKAAAAFNEQLDVKALAGGVYFVNLRTGSGTVTRKIIVQ